MEDERFDGVSRRLAVPATRRGALATLAGLGVLLAANTAAAKSNRNKRRDRKATRKSPQRRVSAASISGADLASVGVSDAESILILSAFERNGPFHGIPLWEHTDLTATLLTGGNADPELVAAIREAIRLWSSVLADHFAGAITLEDVTDDHARAVKADIRVHFIPHWGSYALAGRAVCSNEKCLNIYVKSEWPSANCCKELNETVFKVTPKIAGQIALHELGHALGVGHASPLKETNDIMGYTFAPWFASPPRDQVISTCDLRVIDEVFAWRAQGTPERPSATAIDCATLQPV